MCRFLFGDGCVITEYIHDELQNSFTKLNRRKEYKFSIFTCKHCPKDKINFRNLIYFVVVRTFKNNT